MYSSHGLKAKEVKIKAGVTIDPERHYYHRQQGSAALL